MDPIDPSQPDKIPHSVGPVTPERKLLLVIKAKEKSSTGFESFLRNRGWDVLATSDLKSALAAIFARRIHCVLVTVEHPNPGCLRLPAVIAQTSKTPVILFSEGLTVGGVNILRGTEHPYILVPPVSGPAIERMVLRIEKDLAAIDRPASEGLSTSNTAADGGTIIQRGTKYSEKDFLHLFENDRAAMNSAEAGLGDLQSDGAHDSDGNGNAQDFLGAGSSSSGRGGLVGTRPDRAGLNSTETESRGDPDSSTHQNSEANANGVADTASSGSDSQGSNGESTRPRELGAFASDPKVPRPQGYTSGVRRGVKEFSRLRPDDETSALDRAAATAIRGASVHIVSPDGIIVLERKILLRSVQVESAYFSGVLIIAFAPNLGDLSEFMENFKVLLMGSLNDEGITTSMFEVSEFCLNDMSFEAWSLAEAAFLRKSVHQNSEVGVSFFAHNLNLQPLGRSEDVTMSRFALNEIREQVALPFDVYLYFPVNKKYVRYTAKERFLYDSQRERLTAGGVTDVHIKRESEKDVARYRIQIDLTDKIRTFSGKRGA